MIDEIASGLLVEKKDTAIATTEDGEGGLMTCLVQAAENSSVDTEMVEATTGGEDSGVMMSSSVDTQMVEGTTWGEDPGVMMSSSVDTETVEGTTWGEDSGVMMSREIVVMLEENPKKLGPGATMSGG